MLVEENGADIDVVEQVLHVVLHPGQLLDLGLQFGIHRDQLLIDRLQFFLGGLQLFVGGLKLLVGGLQFLVGGLQFLIGGLLFLDGGLQILLGVGKFALQFFRALLPTCPRCAFVVSGLAMSGIGQAGRQFFGHPFFRHGMRHVLKTHQQQFFAAVLYRQRAHVESYELKMAVGLDRYFLTLERRALIGKF